SWCNWCNCCRYWCCWWRWCPQASPPGSRRSRGPRRSPTPTAPARDAVRGCRRSSSLAFPCQPPAQLVLEQLLLEQLEQQLVVDVVLPNISSRASTRSRTSKVSDSRSSSSPWSSDSALRSEEHTSELQSRFDL